MNVGAVGENRGLPLVGGRSSASAPVGSLALAAREPGGLDALPR